MKATELRIKNFVQDYVGNLFIIEMIRDRDYDYEPIPLTEEWLLKFGFEKKENNRWVHGGFTNPNAPIFYYADIKLFIDGADLWFPGWRRIKISYVHQLQNLYFALTGNELELK